MRLVEILQLTQRAKDDALLKTVLEAADESGETLERKYLAFSRAKDLVGGILNADSGAPYPPLTS